MQKLSCNKKVIEKANHESENSYVYPDIIVHRRGTNCNLCIIEVKKSKSTTSSDYDKIKLKVYTDLDKSTDNELKYQIGLFIKFDKFDSRTSNMKCTIEYFKYGATTEESEKETGERTEGGTKWC